MTRQTDVLVIGGGLHGACTAMNLAARGRTVTLLDKSSGGRHSSASNAGGVRRLMRELAEIPLAMEAARLWKQIENVVGDDCGYQETGQIYLAESEEDIAKLTARRTRMLQLGYEHEEIIDQSELKRLIPAVSNSCIGGLIVRDDGFASPFKTTQAFQKKAISNGVNFIPNQPVLSIDRRKGEWIVKTTDTSYRAQIVINCAGAWGDQIAAMVGDLVPISAEAPTMMVTAPIEPFLKPVVCHASRKLSFKQAPNGIVLIGGGYRGTLNRDTGETQVNFSRLSESARTVLEFFPKIKNVPIVRCWSGIEGLTPDRIPAIGPSLHHDTFFHAFGFSSHGFQLAPIVGQLVAELILSGEPSLSLKAFSLKRFLGADGDRTSLQNKVA